MPIAINLAEKLRAFSDLWSPKIVAQFNGHDVMVVKVNGEFVWHSHADTDDFFLVLKGSLIIQLKDGEVSLGPGDLYVVPKGVEHRPIAAAETHLLLIEPHGTPNTGDPAKGLVGEGSASSVKSTAACHDLGHEAFGIPTAHRCPRSSFSKHVPRKARPHFGR